MTDSAGRPHTGTAFGAPGIEPRWTGSAKEGVGTAYSIASTLWYSISLGIINEVYYPTIDRPQVRDLQYLITDGETFVHEERRHCTTTMECIAPYALGFTIRNTSPDGRYTVVKEVIGDPHQDCLLIRTTLEGDEDLLPRLKLYALLAPHMEISGWGNSGRVVTVAGRRILTATKDGTWLAMGATVPFSRLSCGYVGASDGWTDLFDNFEMDWEFDSAPDGNIALTGQIDLSGGREFVLALSFGDSLHNAATGLFQSLDVPFDRQKIRFIEQWQRIEKWNLPLGDGAHDDGKLYRTSHSLLLAHEDKSFQGALIASLSIPWGEAKGDEDLGGYHLVWTRDLYNSATALLALGHAETPLRALIYLACAQNEAGGFYQNFWINGEPYWHGVQLDETAFPIILAWKLHLAGALRGFDPQAMILRAARYLIVEGPATQQERWEENSGYSPSTLAAHIAGLTCAAMFVRLRGDEGCARFIQEYADFLEQHVERWTVTTRGTLLADVPRHYIRIHPVDLSDPHASEDPDCGILSMRNRPPGRQVDFPAKDIVDAGFLQLVRFGIRAPGDPLIEDSLRVIDAMLKVETPFGPCWRRYNNDGYGQREDGGPFLTYGRGRPWPLLAGERAHYEFAAGRDITDFVRTMEAFANSHGLLPEQIWDEADLPEHFLRFGRSTGSAMPLMWAHAEYVKLLRSIRDGAVFDLIPAVAERYIGNRATTPIEIWKVNRQPRTVLPGSTLRILSTSPFRLHWSSSEWAAAADTPSTSTSLGVEYVDIAVSPEQRAPVRFTFYWTALGKWEGKDYDVAMER
ncbi:MAG: glycoside hydrolase 15-related [Chlorobi bacterium]|nr:glycoside hydrolase 15-related [Chlorobiota bacterium]